ncbi:DUF924 family protein [Marinobacter sp. chi1]|uniref:DUF924 family protein n=1 Tax=Marinobacter suaedae TaxID=3057675 RepID=A0ABT8W1B6_9GAMM|nr:DUF924 family protein [Marinobacter sp. chi1]MDO3722017.1 DUF924 family protein [Marinobacter sp. chi1]
MFDWKEILDFWFGELDGNGLPDHFHRSRWFHADRKFDQELRRRFMSMIVLASEGGLSHWRVEAGGRLAEILLLDQFSRNVFRGSALAFEQDSLAKKLCHQAMRAGHDMELPPVQRAFLYMPLKHSERIDDQSESVDCYEQLFASTQGVLKELMASFAQSARDHRDIVDRFGRFPHRNAALGRVSRPEENEYLKKARRFGQ